MIIKYDKLISDNKNYTDKGILIELKLDFTNWHAVEQKKNYVQCPNIGHRSVSC